MSVLVSLVFLMTYKPSLVGAVMAVVTAIAAGVPWSVSPELQSLARALIGLGRRRGNDSPYGVQASHCQPFWDAAVALDHAATDWNQAARFPICRPTAAPGMLPGCRLRGRRRLSD